MTPGAPRRDATLLVPGRDATGLAPGWDATRLAPRRDATGLVLAGGRGRRMGGADKGLLPWRGQPLAAHALARLAPQVAACAISANRHAARYAQWGVPVWADADAAAFDGPLAGLLAGLRACTTPWLLTVPCDAPAFPADLAQRLADAAQAAGAPLALAEAAGRLQPVFALVHTALAPSLAAYLAGGGRAVHRWAAAAGHATAHFDDAAAFASANTPAALRELEINDK